VDSAADGRVGPDAGAFPGWPSAGLELTDAPAGRACSRKTVEHALRVRAERRPRWPGWTKSPPSRCPRLTLPEVIHGIELGAIYELAEKLREQGVQAHAVPRPAKSGR